MPKGDEIQVFGIPAPAEGWGEEGGRRTRAMNECRIHPNEIKFPVPPFALLSLMGVMTESPID